MEWWGSNGDRLAAVRGLQCRSLMKKGLRCQFKLVRVHTILKWEVEMLFFVTKY